MSANQRAKNFSNILSQSTC